jgi:hypothetical protein
MPCLDFFAPSQIRNRAAQFQDAVIGTRRQIKLRHRRPHQTLTLRLRSTQRDAFILQLAKLPYLPDAHIGVCMTNNT